MLLFLSIILLPERDEHQHTAVESSGVTIHSFTYTLLKNRQPSSTTLCTLPAKQTVSSLFHHTNNDHVSLSLTASHFPHRHVYQNICI